MAGRSLVATIVRRLALIVLVVVAAPSLTFVIFGALRGGRTLWAQLGLLPAYVTRTFAHFDLGTTGTTAEPVSRILVSGLPVDLGLLAGGLVLGVAIGLMTGTLAGPRAGRGLDRGLNLGSAVGLSAPVYWLAYMALIGFAPDFGRLPVPFASSSGRYASPTSDPLAWLQALWVPWVVLAIPVAAACHRMTRASLVEVLDEDFLRTARAKGLSERTVLWRHALPAALAPVVALVSASLAAIITNAVLIEVPFNLPGAFRGGDVGQFLGDQARPPPLNVVQALVLEAAAIIAIGSALCDLVLARLDPRVRDRG